jgi:predicted component of type VI protein secretion system
MVKKGEYLEYALKLYEEMEDFDPMDMNRKTYSTEMAIILECANKIKELENKILELEKKEVI